jgi:hypothetical protein
MVWCIGEFRCYVGMRRNPVGADDPSMWMLNTDRVIKLELDRPSGELIDEIAVSERPDDTLAFKVSCPLSDRNHDSYLPAYGADQNEQRP